jgi:uncharacterized membrane protein YqgA involved in biofilm formation
MTGTIINVITVLIGGAAGILLGGKIPERLRTTVVHGLGLFTLVLGVRLFLQTDNPLYPLGAILPGGLVGEWGRGLSRGFIQTQQLVQVRICSSGVL